MHKHIRQYNIPKKKRANINELLFSLYEKKSLCRLPYNIRSEYYYSPAIFYVLLLLLLLLVMPYFSFIIGFFGRKYSCINYQM